MGGGGLTTSLEQIVVEWARHAALNMRELRSNRTSVTVGMLSTSLTRERQLQNGSKTSPPLEEPAMGRAGAN